jgi:hypothetical protein
MSQIAYRANLNSSHFPLLSAHHGQTVIVPARDQAFRNQVVIGQESEDKDTGIPQLYYCHNVVPTVSGIQSVGFVPRIPKIADSSDFDDIFILRDADEVKRLYSPANGKNYVFDGNTWTWASSSPQTVSSGNFVSVAYINGHTYIFYPRFNLSEYDPGTGTLLVVPLTGLTIADILGVCAANGFLIAWDEFSVYRSKATDPLDFTPDFSLGSGASIPDAEAGKIVACLPITGGFLIYTTQNIVAAAWSQNIRYPFTYTEVQGSAGILSPRHVAYANNIGVHYTWTKAGLHKIDKIRSVPVFPEVTDFLTSGIFEDYDPVTNEFLITELSGALYIKLAFAGRRFLIISYGILGSTYTHAIIYDIELKRFGKVRLTHVAAFEFLLPGTVGDTTWNDFQTLSWDAIGDTSWDDLAVVLSTTEEPKSNIAFIQKDGTVYTLNFDEIHEGDVGVAIFGKYQFVRERNLILHEISTENVRTILTNFTVTQLLSMDGRSIDYKLTPYLATNKPNYRNYLCKPQEAKNHSLVFYGTFSFNTVNLKFSVGSHR